MKNKLTKDDINLLADEILEDLTRRVGDNLYIIALILQEALNHNYIDKKLKIEETLETEEDGSV